LLQFSHVGLSSSMTPPRGDGQGRVDGRELAIEQLHLQGSRHASVAKEGAAGTNAALLFYPEAIIRRIYNPFNHVIHYKSGEYDSSRPVRKRFHPGRVSNFSLICFLPVPGRIRRETAKRLDSRLDHPRGCRLLPLESPRTGDAAGLPLNAPAEHTTCR